MDAMYDPWSTHLPALATAVMTYGRRVLEIGCGWYSTPLLYAMSKQVITLESDPIWASKFKNLANTQLQPNIVEAAAAWAVHAWDVVFIDCEGDQLRLQCANLFLDKECCIVAHDTEAPYWKETLKNVNYQRHFDFIMPRTSWLSNVLDVTK